MPEVTVVIPTQSRWGRLSTRALPTAMAQAGVDLEVIVVDDASADDTAANLGLLSDEPRLRVVAHSKPRGLAHARNSGIAAARGEWVAFLDDDDVWSPFKLRRQLDAAQAANASFVYSTALYVDTDGKSVELAAAPDPDALAARLLSGEAIPAGGSNVIVKTSAIRKVGGFDEAFVHLSDFDCWIRLDRVCRVAASEEPLVAYMQHSEAMHLRKARHVVSDVRRLHRKYRSDYAVLGREFDGEGFLLFIAHQHRVAGRRFRAAGVHLIAGARYRSPRHFGRAIVLLTGERGMAAARRVSRSHRGVRQTPRPRSVEAAPTWLAPYLS
jgi:glycosyltransferase involved in cell wall biosynthesis